MVDTVFINQVAWIIVSSFLGALVATRLGLPSVLGFMTAGILIGPVGGFVESSAHLEELSHIGIVLLLYLVGLELSFERVRRIGWIALGAGTLQIVFTFALSYLILSLLAMDPGSIWILASGLTLSSTIVAVKILEQKRATQSLHGQIALGILLVQDLAVVIILSILSVSGSGDGGSAKQILATVRSFAGLAVLAFIAIVTARTFLSKRFTTMSRDPTTLFIWGICWLFVVVVLAEALHVSHEAGAFLAGFALAQLPFNHDLRRRSAPLSHFFTAVFFTLLGVKFETDLSNVNWGHIAILSGFVLFAKPVIIGVVCRILGTSRQTGFLTAITLGHTSEFSFLLVLAAASTGRLDATEAGLLTIVGMATLSIGSVTAFYGKQIGEFLRALPVGSGDGQTPHAIHMRNHVIVVGMNTLGKRIVHSLVERGVPTLAVDTDAGKLKDLPCETLIGSVDQQDVLEETRLADARLLVSALRIESVNDLLAYRCKQHGVPSAIHAVDKMNLDILLSMKTSYILLPKLDGIKRLAKLLEKLGYTSK